MLSFVSACRTCSNLGHHECLTISTLLSFRLGKGKGSSNATVICHHRELPAHPVPAGSHEIEPALLHRKISQSVLMTMGGLCCLNARVFHGRRELHPQVSSLGLKMGRSSWRICQASGGWTQQRSMGSWMMSSPGPLRISSSPPRCSMLCWIRLTAQSYKMGLSSG